MSADKLFNWLEGRFGLDGGISYRDILRGFPVAFRAKKTFDSALAELVSDGKVRSDGKMVYRLSATPVVATVVESVAKSATKPATPVADLTTTRFDRAYARLDKFSGNGMAMVWFQDKFPELCKKLVTAYFMGQKDSKMVWEWAKMETGMLKIWRGSGGVL